MRTRLIAAPCGLALIAALAGCSSWSGADAEAIDRAVDALDFSTVGEVVCDHKRPRTWTGAQNIRTIAIADRSNGDRVLAFLRQEGYSTDGYTDDLRHGFMFMRSDAAGIGVSLTTEEDGRIGLGCETPAEGAVIITITR